MKTQIAVLVLSLLGSAFAAPIAQQQHHQEESGLDQGHGFEHGQGFPTSATPSSFPSDLPPKPSGSAIGFPGGPLKFANENGTFPSGAVPSGVFPTDAFPSDKATPSGLVPTGAFPSGTASHGAHGDESGTLAFLAKIFGKERVDAAAGAAPSGFPDRKGEDKDDHRHHGHHGKNATESPAFPSGAAPSGAFASGLPEFGGDHHEPSGASPSGTVPWDSFPSGFPSGVPSGFPSGFPSGIPSGFPSGFPKFGGEHHHRRPNHGARPTPTSVVPSDAPAAQPTAGTLSGF